MNGKLDLLGAGYVDPRKLEGDDAESVAELDVHARTLRSLAHVLPQLLRLLSEPEGEERDAVIAALWTGTVIWYARCFDTTNRHALKADQVFPDDVVQQAHTSAAVMRSKHLAHDVNGFRFCAVGVERNPEGEPGRLIRAFGEHIPGEADVLILKYLAQEAFVYAERQRSSHAQRLIDAINRLSADELGALPPMVFEGLHDAPVKVPRRSQGKRRR